MSASQSNVIKAIDGAYDGVLFWDNGFLLAVLSSLYWGLVPHDSHCKLFTQVVEFVGFGAKTPCPPHWVHLSMGAAFYFLAMYMAQKKYLFPG